MILALVDTCQNEYLQLGTASLPGHEEEAPSSRKLSRLVNFGAKLFYAHTIFLPGRPLKRLIWSYT
jgi:hypothetical protein